MKTKLLILITLLAASGTALTAQTNVTVDISVAYRKPISQYIYGVNPYHYNGALTGMALHSPGVNVTSLRFGGDAVSTYNWEINRSTNFEQVCGTYDTGQLYLTNSNTAPTLRIRTTCRRI